MKKEYKTPVSEKIEFDYTETVVASNNQQLFGTSDEPWCHKILGNNAENA